MRLVHLTACIAALAVGALVIVLPKGTRRHRVLGRMYVVATVVYAGASFFMYPSTGRLTPFHAISIGSGLNVASCRAGEWNWGPAFDLTRPGSRPDTRTAAQTMAG